MTQPPVIELAPVIQAGLFCLFWVFVVIGLGKILMEIPNNRQAVNIALVCITILGIALRLWVAVTYDRLLGSPVQLIGDEPRYDYLAYSLLKGEFFQKPLATPIYPLFLAVCYWFFGHSYAAVQYIQAFVGSTVIPLTFILAKRFTDMKSSLLAAVIVALIPALIYQVPIIYTEVLYTPLLLLTTLSLLWAIEEPKIRRFVLAGALLGISTLCRPATAFLPLILPLIMPRNWGIKKQAILFMVYTCAMVGVIAPWTYHNYRTYNIFMPFGLSLTTLWGGSPEFYHIMRMKKNAKIRVWEEELNPERNGGIDPLTIDGDRYFNDRAIASILSEPKIYAWYSLQKLAYFWIGHPAAYYDWPHDIPLRPYFTVNQIAVHFGVRLLLLTSTITGLIILRHRLRDFVTVLAIIGYFMLVYAILNPVARYSTPLYPILAVIIATATSEVLRRLTTQSDSSDLHYRWSQNNKF
jgi:4-amino-4-deoxy-L-arabinose transferase-like glycosyltransferase